MNIYISIPITGRPEKVARVHAEFLKNVLESYGHKCVTPFDVCPEKDKPYSHYMGKDIEKIISNDIDALVFGRGYSQSKGCRLEHKAAEIYRKHIIYESFSNITNNPFINQNSVTMKKKYRIKEVQIEDPQRGLVPIFYAVQVKTWLGFWVNVKIFEDPWDPDFAKREAEELLMKLEEK